MVKVFDVNQNETKYIRLWLDGEELSNRCFFAEVPDEPGIEGQGILYLYVVDENGAFQLDDTDDLLQEVKSGMIKWERQEVTHG